jgi:hypothetical protein
VVLDHGCVREFEPATTDALKQLSGAVRRDDAPALRDALTRLGAPEPGSGERFHATRRLLRGFYAPLLQSGLHPVEGGLGIEARTLMKSKREMMRIGLPGKLLFLLRIRFGLHSELTRLGAVADWAALEDQLIGEIAAGDRVAR